MTCVYHAIPRNMSGTVLYPLNELRDINNALYQEHAEKYRGRERVMRRRIHLLDNCLWNDVLFLTAVHPAQFRKAFESVGYAQPRPFRAYEINLAELDQSRMAVITKMQMNEPLVYEPFDQLKLNQYSTIPQATFDYWREEKAAGQGRPFLYLHIPHILYRGTLDTTTASIVEA
jgi:hypothetical protein